MRQVWLALAVVSVSSWLVASSFRLLEPDVLSVIVALAFAFGALYALESYGQRTNPESERFGRPSYLVPDEREVELLLGHRTEGDVLSFQRLAYAVSLGFPKLIYSRLLEAVEPAYRSSIVTARYDLSFVWLREEDLGVGDGLTVSRVGFPEGEGTIAVPLTLLQRGQVVSSLAVLDGQGKGVPSLPSREVNLLNLGVARWYVEQVDATKLSSYIELIEPEYRQLLSSTEPPSVEHLDAFMLSLRESLGNPEGELMDLAESYFRDTIRFIPICAIVSLSSIRDPGWPNLVRYTISYRTLSRGSLPSATGPGLFQRAADLLRLALGVPLMRYYVTLANASRARSYHLEVVGPPGTYLAGQKLLLPAASSDQEVTVSALTDSRIGQRRARLYVRELSSPEGKEPSFAAKFHERAPGSFLPLTVIHLALAVVIAIVSSLLATGRGLEPGGYSPLISVLVALPVGAAAVAGLDGYRKYRHPSLLSLFLNAMVFVLSVSAVALLLLGQTDRVLEDFWTLIQSAAWMCVVIAAATWILRATTESKIRSVSARP